MKQLIILVLLLWIFSCSTDNIKEGINKVGDAAGQTAGEFIEGAAKGVEKAFDVKVTLPENLKQHGIEFGKTYVTSDTIGTDNLLMVYVIFNKPYTDTLVAKVFDDQHLEMGRVSSVVSGLQNEAKFVEFHFDKRTNIDSKNVLTVE